MNALRSALHVMTACAVLACGARAGWAQTVVFSDNFDSGPEGFETMPGWQSTAFDGTEATWSIALDGESGKCLQVSATASGHSARVLRYDTANNTAYTISIYMRSAGAAASYTAAVACKIGDYGARDFIDNRGSWTEIQRFQDSGPDGNGNTWTEYTASLTSDTSGKLSIGFRLEASSTSTPVIQFDTLVAPRGGVLHAGWETPPGRAGYPLSPMNGLIGSPPGHKKNHTGPAELDGSAFEVDNNPNPYASYREFDPQTGILTIDAYIWDDVESRKPQAMWGSPEYIDGGVTMTSLPSDSPTSVVLYGYQTGEIYTYEDFAFVGVHSAIVKSGMPDPNGPGFQFWNPPSPGQPSDYCYQWRTATDGWHLTLNPNTGHPVPRRADFHIPEQIPQTWRHVRIVVKPYTGSDHDIELYMDDPQNPEQNGGPLVLVGHGHRVLGSSCKGANFRRAQLGTRFPEVADANNWKPPYSYEHFWFDDASLAVSPSTAPVHVRFDADTDGDVDENDYGVFQACYTGRATLSPDASQVCRCMNSNPSTDQVIDSIDLGAFVNCVTGPMISADASCEPSP